MVSGWLSKPQQEGVAVSITGSRHEAASAAMQQIRSASSSIVEMIESAPNGSVPRFRCETGGYRLEPAYRPDSWADFQWVGFLAGRLWLTARHFGDDRIAVAARKLAATVATRLSARRPEFSTAGADIFYAVCVGARYDCDDRLAAQAVEAARRYAENFDESLGIFFQVQGVNRAVIDTGLNLLPFYWAARYDSTLSHFASSHNSRLLDAGIVRADGSVNQAIEFDLPTGTVSRRWNMQGYSNSSTWARGQAWAVHNYVGAYEATGDDLYLQVARTTGKWFVDHLPSDGIPFYDFADPDAPAVPRDSCSAAICANALLRLCAVDPSARPWARPAADSMLDELLKNYLSPGGVVLHGSWGRLPAEKAGAAMSRFPLEDVMPYGNYWLVECLYRQLNDDWSLLSLTA
jgi:unsaturated chondroitin disaccharide hydrolase